MRTRSRSCADWPSTIPTPLSPASSTDRVAELQKATASRATAWPTCVTTGRSHASSRRPAPPKASFNSEVAEGFLPMREAIRALGVSRQTVLQRVKRGELEAVHVMRGRQKGLRIKVIAQQSSLFDQTA